MSLAQMWIGYPTKKFSEFFLIGLNFQWQKLFKVYYYPSH
jgi:hypothetical protein